MSAESRLGKALAQYIAGLRGGEGESMFVRLDAIPEDVAMALAESWMLDDVPVAVVSGTPQRFGARALSGAGTNLRNRNRQGVCLVVCEGQVLEDDQSLRAFSGVATTDLLRTADNLSLLANVEPGVPVTGVVRDVRSAIEQLRVAERPSALNVSGYLETVASGSNPLEALPRLGAFRDDSQGEGSNPARIRENLQLARRRRSDEIQRHGGLGDMRRRAERVLSRRHGSQTSSAELADEVMRLLQDGDDALLSELSFDEAREILERRQASDLITTVIQELDDYRRQLEREDPDNPVPWNRYRDCAVNLGSPDVRKEAASDLIAFDDSRQRQCFSRNTRTKLDRLLKDRVIKDASPEVGLLGAVLALDGGLGRVELVAPDPPVAGGRPSRRLAIRRLTIGCARLRLQGLLRSLNESFGVEVDPALLVDANPADDAAFEEAEITATASLETVKLRLHGAGTRDVLLLEWRPDLDDLALLRAASLFGAEKVLTFDVPSSPTLESYCGGDSGAARAVSDGLTAPSRALKRCCRLLLQDGLSSETLDAWTQAWRRAVDAACRENDDEKAAELALAGTVCGAGAVGMTPLAPLKAEWLSQYVDALWSLVFLSLHGDAGRDEPLERTVSGVAGATASHYPAHVRVEWSDRPLLPTAETRIWSTFGGPASESAHHGGAALRGVLQRLLQLQPEAAGHLRCIAAGPGAADLLVREGADLVGTSLGGVPIERIEIYCIGLDEATRPVPATLKAVDEDLAGVGRARLELRYLADLEEAKALLDIRSDGTPAVHLALVCGITGEASRLAIETPEVEPPPETDEVLFVPRTSLRPRQMRRTLLAPPAVTATGRAWLELMHAMDDGWRETEEVKLRVPELRTTGADLREPLRDLHDLALWVATLDPYASRDSLQAALGADVAILHQERRLGGESPLALVISQRSGGPADNAVGRSLQAAGIVGSRDSATGIGADLRRVAAQGYGILALEAATTGAGVNELVGHVVAFSMLATRTTPWPLPPDCRLLLVSLDDYKHWFPGKRADLLVLAIDERDGGVHGAVIEVKARRSDASIAETDALDQLRQTLHLTRWAGYPDPGSVHSRLWLNRIAEAAIAVARESNVRLSAGELSALESFRAGYGTLEWAGIGLVFGPDLPNGQRDRQEPIAGDLVPISISTVGLTESLLRSAAGTELAELRTVEAERQPLGGGRLRRRPERRSESPSEAPTDEESTAHVSEPSVEPPNPVADIETPERPINEGLPEQQVEVTAEDDTTEATTPIEETVTFTPPILGWEGQETPVLWPAAGENALPNGHMEIWGSSGAGKTQFIMALLSQLSVSAGTHFGVADFKSDYGDAFPAQANATFMDLWDGAPFNPLALPSRDEREVRSAVIELRDIVEVATQSFTRMGVRQKSKLKDALEECYASTLNSGSWPTLRTLDGLLDDDLRAVIGDLTSEPIFGEGRPLGDAVDENVIFGLSRIPGNGLTTVLAAGFILSALQLRIQGSPQVANTVRYAVVVDEAHRVSAFKAIDTMIREGRSKGLAVLLATQQPGDLPEVVATNAQTRVCFRLPDAAVATAAARRLDPNDRELPEQIRTLGAGEAYVALGGAPPRLVRMVQNYRDRPALGLNG